MFCHVLVVLQTKTLRGIFKTCLLWALLRRLWTICVIQFST